MRKSWPTIRFIARLERRRDHVRGGRVIRTERETIYLITSLPGATPKRIMSVNRGHWRIKAMHRDRDVTPGEDRPTNHLDHAPQDIFTLTSATRTVPKRVSNSPTRTIETFRTSRTMAIRFLAKGHNNFYRIALFTIAQCMQFSQRGDSLKNQDFGLVNPNRRRYILLQARRKNEGTVIQ